MSYIGGKDERKGETVVESNLGTEMEINADRGDLLIRVFLG